MNRYSLLIIMSCLTAIPAAAQTTTPMSNNILQPIIEGARDYSNDRAREKRRERREDRDDRREREHRRDRNDDRRHHQRR